jgi:hypothetical protein
VLTGQAVALALDTHTVVRVWLRSTGTRAPECAK